MITEYPLTKAHRIRLARAFKHIPRVDMSIDCAIEGQMGRALVDDSQEPTVFKIEVGPFFYFAGDATGPGGRAMLENIVPYTLFMPSSPGWIEAGKTMYGERMVGFDRYSFSSQHIKHLDHVCQTSAFREDVRRMDLGFAAQLWGQDHFVDLSDFDSAEDFVHRGIGFYLEKHGTVVGAAYSSLVCSKGIEVSLFVMEDYRRQGIATLLASRLLGWCIENNAEANWDAANLESCRLAEKLGYVPTGEYQAYYLKAE
ncbi:MAG: GNAT family N-acetyltransferase [Anaerolineae bacterium]|nr:GNAT family N-acetyltransferase [Anaerolineae bacterium]